jgi:hypothetical protein
VSRAFCYNPRLSLGWVVPACSATYGRRQADRRRHRRLSHLRPVPRRWMDTENISTSN